MRTQRESGTKSKSHMEEGWKEYSRVHLFLIPLLSYIKKIFVLLEMNWKLLNSSPLLTWKTPGESDFPLKTLTIWPVSHTICCLPLGLGLSSSVGRWLVLFPVVAARNASFPNPKQFYSLYRIHQPFPVTWGVSWKPVQGSCILYLIVSECRRPAHSSQRCSPTVTQWSLVFLGQCWAAPGV